MSPDNEYISLIMYAITIKIDLCNFLAIWEVLSILLDTQSNTLQHVKSFKQVVNNYYDKCPTDMMSELEQQASIIMKAMYDSVNNEHSDSVSGDIDRVSGAADSDCDINDYDKDENAMPYCYIIGLGLNCKFIDLMFKRSVLIFIKISSFIVSMF